MKANVDLIMVCAGSQGPADKMHVPLGLLYIGSELERNGYDVKIHHLLPEEFEDALPKIRAREPLWVGLSVLSGMTTYWAANHSKRIRETMPGTPIVWGGPHASAMPAACAREPYVDYVVRGEGEVTAVELSEALHSGSDVTGIASLGYKTGEGTSFVNTMRPLVEDIDRYEINWELLDLEEYKSTSYKQTIGKQSIAFFSSRGCPYKCAFCSTPRYTGKSFRGHSPGYVERNLAYLKERYGFNSVYFSDDNFMTDRERGLEVIRRVTGLGISVDTLDVRLNQLNDDVMSQFNDMGAQGIFFGWESANDRILKLMRKGLTVDLIREKAKLFKKHGITAWASSIIGSPTETREEIYNTIDFSMWLRDTLPTRSTVASFRYMPLPNTALIEVAVEEGFVVPERQEDWKIIDPIGPYYEMPWVKWRTPDDEKFLAFAQELSRNGMLNMIPNSYYGLGFVHNFFVHRMRSKVLRRQREVDTEYRAFYSARNTASRIVRGRRASLDSQAMAS